MILFKGCPRCRGDLHTRADMYGEYAECLQCGYVRDVQPAQTRVEAAQPSAGRPSKAHRAA